MTADELKSWRLRHSLPQREAAYIVGLTLRGYQYCEAGTRPVSDSVERLTRYFETFGPLTEKPPQQ